MIKATAVEVCGLRWAYLIRIVRKSWRARLNPVMTLLLATRDSLLMIMSVKACANDSIERCACRRHGFSGTICMLFLMALHYNSRGCSLYRIAMSSILGSAQSGTLLGMVTGRPLSVLSTV